MTRVIDILRKQFPGKWTYNPRTFMWENKAACLVAWKVAVSAPRYDGDDDHFETRLVLWSMQSESQINMIGWPFTGLSFS